MNQELLDSLHILSSSILTTIKHFYPQFRNEDTEACPGVSAQFFCLLLYYSMLVALPASWSVIDSNPTLYQKKRKGERLEGFRQSTLNCLLVCIRNLWDMSAEKYMCKKSRWPKRDFLKRMWFCESHILFREAHWWSPLCVYNYFFFLLFLWEGKKTKFGTLDNLRKIFWE